MHHRTRNTGAVPFSGSSSLSLSMKLLPVLWAALHVCLFLPVSCHSKELPPISITAVPSSEPRETASGSVWGISVEISIPRGYRNATAAAWETGAACPAPEPDRISWTGYPSGGGRLAIEVSTISPAGGRIIVAARAIAPDGRPVSFAMEVRVGTGPATADSGRVSALSIPEEPGPKVPGRVLTRPDGSRIRVLPIGREASAGEDAPDGKSSTLSRTPPAPGNPKRPPKDGGAGLGKGIFAKRINSEEARILSMNPVRPWEEAGGITSGKGTVTAGAVRILVIPVGFTDVAFATDLSTFSTRLDEVRNYFQAVSGSRLSLSFTIASSGGGAFQTGKNMSTYGANSGENIDPNIASLVTDSLNLVNPFHDFSQFDSVMIFHAGAGEEALGTPDTCIWSVHVNLGTPYSADGVYVHAAMIMPETYQPYSSDSTLGVICHEYGHELGLPDLYDTDDGDGSDTEGVGEWCLMGSGGWLGNGASPAEFCAWSKKHLGWITVEDIKTPATAISLNQIETGRKAMRIWIDRDNGEYFLLENRQKAGRDTQIRGEGILIWHIDESLATRPNWSVNNIVNADGPHKMVDLEEADGMDNLDFKDNRSDPGDPWSSGMSFAADTSPDSAGYGGASGVSVTGFSVSGSTMTFNVDIPFDTADTTSGTNYIDLEFTRAPAIPQALDPAFYTLSGAGNPASVTQVGDRALRLFFGSSIDRTSILTLIVSGPIDGGGNPLFTDPRTIVNPAGTNIGGYLPSETVLDTTGSPYYVTRDLIVVQAAMLIISPGALLLFKKEIQADTFPSDKVDLVVYGKLSITGSEAGMVVMDSADAAPAMGDWGGVFISGGSDTDSSLSWVRISHARRGIYATQVMVEVSNAEILDFSDTGIYLDSTIRNRVAGCAVKTTIGGSRAGLKVTNESEAVIHGCSFTADNGVNVSNNSRVPEFFGNNVTGSNFGVIKVGAGFTLDAKYNYWSGNSQNTTGLVNATPTLASRADPFFVPVSSRFTDALYGSSAAYLDPASIAYAEVTGGDRDAGVINRLVLVARSSSTDTKGIRVPFVETGAATGVYRASFTLGSSSAESPGVLGALAGETVEIFWPGAGGTVLTSIPVGRLPSAPVLTDPGVISTDGNYNVSWSSADAADSYFLEEADNISFSGAATYNAGAGLSRAFAGKVQGTWYYRVRGFNAFGPGPWSNAESIQVVVVGIPLLSTPAPLDSDGSYPLSWTNVAGANPYELEESSDQVFTSPFPAYSGTDLTTILSGKSEGVRFYRVRALVSGVPGEWSNVVRVAVNTQVLITGRVRFEDRDFDATGFTGTSWTVARGFVVEAVRISNPSVVLASARTNAAGFYSIDLTGSAQPDVAMLVICRAGAGADSVKVYDTTASMALYAAMDDNGGAGYDATDGTDPAADIDVTIAGGLAGAFNIASVAVQCHDTLINRLGAATPSLVEVFWVSGTGNSTYYQTGRIFVAGSAADPDEFDDTVLAHEYAHFVLVSYSRDDTPGGDHSSTEKIDLRLAWSEGFSTFFACFVRNESLYADTNAAGVFSYEIETPTPHPNRTGSDNETSVAATLWDIVDPVDEDFDGPITVSYGSVDTPGEAVFHVISSTMPSLANLSIEDFWHGWFHGAHNFANDEVMTSIFASRGMDFTADAVEPDGAVIPAAPHDIPLARTFYPAADQDWFTFMATPGLPVAAETYTLANGCDTVVTVFDSTGAMVAENDNEASGEYRSRAVFTPATAGPFKVMVTTRGETRFADYGSYEFRVGHNILAHASMPGPLAIPDNGGTAFEMQIAQTYAVKSVALRLRVSHPAAGELSVFLRSPSGVTVEVARGLPEGLEEFSVWIPGQAAPYGDMTKFIGAGVAGTWRLSMTDSSPGNAGVLKGWSLRLGIENPPDKPILNDPGDTDSDGSYSISWYPVEGADLYELQEDEDAFFGTPTPVYSGAALTTSVSGRQTGRYNYRVRARKLGAYFGLWSYPQTIDVILGTVAIASPNFGQDFETRFATQTISGLCSATAVTIEVNGSAAGIVHAHGSTSWSYKATLVEGPNIFTFTAFDAQGDPGPSDTIVITLDTAAPDKPSITTNGGADIETRAATITLQGSCGVGVSVIKVNGSPSGVAFIGGTTAWNYTGTLVPGANAYAVTASDKAGNASPAARISVTSDPFPPQKPTITTNAGAGFTTSAAYVTLEGWCSTDTETISVNGFAVGVTHTAGTNFWSHFSALALGTNNFTVMASDRVGNISPQVTITVVYSPKAVETTILSGPSGTLTWNEGTFIFSSSETKAWFAWKLSPIETGFTSWSAANTVTYQGLSPGIYTFSVKSRASDGTEDPSPAVRLFEIVSVAAGQILVNEVFPGPGAWVEIYNSGTSDVNLTGWKVDASGAVFTFPTFTLRSRSFVVLREVSSPVATDSIDFGTTIPFVPGGGGSVSILDSFDRGADFVRWGPSTAVPPDGTGFTGSSASPVSGQSLARGPRPEDFNLSSDFTAGDLVTPGGPNLGGTGLLQTGSIVSEPAPVVGYGSDTLVDGSRIFNSDYAVNNGRFPVRITLGFGSLVEVAGVTITNDGQYGARSVRISAVDQAGTVTPVTSRLSLPAITAAPTPTAVSFGLTRCSGLVLDFDTFHNRTWFQLNEIEVRGIDSPGEETALDIVSATSSMNPYPGHGPGLVYDGKSVYNNGFVVVNRGNPVDLVFDLGSFSTLRALEHHNDGEYGGLAASLSVSASKDGPWTRVYTLANLDTAPGGVRVETFRFMEARGRFVKLSYTAFANPVWFQVAEIVPRGTAGSSQAGEQVAPVSAWSSPGGYPGYEAQALHDGSVGYNSDFAVLHGCDPVSVTFDFGGAVTIDRVETVNDGEFGASKVAIYAGDSLDRKASTFVASFDGLSSSPGLPTPDSVTMDLVSCRYMRLVYTGFINSRWLQLNEIRFHGAGLTEQPGKSPVSSVTVSITAWPGYGPEKLIDGKELFNSDFAAVHCNSPVEVILDLPVNFRVTSLRHVNDGPYGAISLIVYTAQSSSPNDFTLAGSFDSMGWSQSSPVPDLLTLQPVEARRVKIRYIAFRHGKYLQVNEIDVLGSAVAPGAPLPVTHARITVLEAASEREVKICPGLAEFRTASGHWQYTWNEESSGAAGSLDAHEASVEVTDLLLLDPARPRIGEEGMAIVAGRIIPGFKGLSVPNAVLLLRSGNSSGFESGTTSTYVLAVSDMENFARCLAMGCWDEALISTETALSQSPGCLQARHGDDYAYECTENAIVQGILSTAGMAGKMKGAVLRARISGNGQPSIRKGIDADPSRAAVLSLSLNGGADDRFDFDLAEDRHCSPKSVSRAAALELLRSWNLAGILKAPPAGLIDVSMLLNRAEPPESAIPVAASFGWMLETIRERGGEIRGTEINAILLGDALREICRDPAFQKD